LSGIGVAARSAWLFDLPPSAVLKTREIATLVNDDAAYGRSLTYWSRRGNRTPRRMRPTGSTSSRSAAVHRSSVASG
jgi:hypothetical protein